MGGAPPLPHDFAPHPPKKVVKSPPFCQGGRIGPEKGPVEAESDGLLQVPGSRRGLGGLDEGWTPGALPRMRLGEPISDRNDVWVRALPIGTPMCPGVAVCDSWESVLGRRECPTGSAAPMWQFPSEATYTRQKKRSGKHTSLRCGTRHIPPALIARQGRMSQNPANEPPTPPPRLANTQGHGCHHPGEPSPQPRQGGLPAVGADWGRAYIRGSSFWEGTLGETCGGDPWEPPGRGAILGVPGTPLRTHSGTPARGSPGAPPRGGPGGPRPGAGSAHFGGYLITLPVGTERRFFPKSHFSPFSPPGRKTPQNGPQDTPQDSPPADIHSC